MDNLRAAVEWVLAPGGDAVLALDLIGHSMRLLFELALFPELIRDVSAGLARIDDATPPASVARLWLAKNFCIDRFGNPSAAAAALRAVEIYRGLADPQALGVALTRAGASLCAPGETAEGEAMLREARAILQPLGRSKHLPSVLICWAGAKNFRAMPKRRGSS